MTYRKASVIIPTFNKCARLALVLESIRRQSCDSELFEVVAIDDGSSDRTESIVKKYRSHLNIRYFYQQNQGRSAARNKGVEAARNELLIFFDDDTILSRDFIKEHIGAHTSKNLIIHGKICNLSYLKFFEDPSCGVIYRHLQMKHSAPVALDKYLIAPDDILTMDKIVRQAKMTAFEKQIDSIFADEIRPLFWLGFTGGNVSVSKRSLLEHGMFDEAFSTTWGGEDLELGYRLFLAGMRFKYCRRAVNYHIAHYRADWQDQLRRSMDYFSQKHDNKYVRSLYKLLSGEISTVSEFLSMAGQ